MTILESGGLPYILGQTSFLSVDRFALMADLYGVELLGRDLFFIQSPAPLDT